MTLRALGTFGFVLTVLAMPVAANAQGVVPGDQKGASQLVVHSKPTSKSRKQIARAQNRVNRYFRDAVVTPKLRECWSRLQGRGDIAMGFTYKKTGSHWAFEKIALIKSNLPAGQDEVALRCMQDSVGATSFPVKDTDLRETYAKALVVRWTWPVPLPPKGAKTARIRGGGGLGDTGGACQDCVSRGTYPYGLKCKASSSGSSDCRSDISTPNVCSTGTPCLSGIFGTSGGYIIY
jgi:hypothetical protein